MSRLLALAVYLLLHTVNGDTGYRLNTPIVPTTYSIIITPRFNTSDDTAFTFDGNVAIKFLTTEPTATIRFHSQDLIFNVSDVAVTSRQGAVVLNTTSPLEFDTKYSFATISLATEFVVDEEYVLTIAYSGPIRSDLLGFYRNYYKENGVKKWLGATQMEPTHARKVFPCFDEPHLKAIFYLSIDRPSSYKTSLANTKLLQSETLNNGYVRDIFHPTPIMSTYLVAFLISEFETTTYNNTEGREFGVFTRPDAVNQTDYAFDFGQRVVKALGDYLGIDYYSIDSNLKLDHIALPNFRAGAMENWGLIDYREGSLLYVPEESLPTYKYRVAQIIAHETAHMWFGNLVTCHWWSDTWLNEGFASYFQDYITSLIEPSVESSDVLVTGGVYTTYDADDDPSSVPISNENVNSPEEISAHFGSITYQKAGSVIRMIHHLIGDTVFRAGLSQYLNLNRLNSGYPEKLYSALNTAIQSSTLIPRVNIVEVLESWITQPGYPLLNVNINYETGIVTLNQKRYYKNSSHSSNETYAIPVTYAISEADFQDTHPKFIMNGKTLTFKVENITTEPIFFNVQETGVYRVNYDDKTWSYIIETLKGPNREKVHHLNRAKIVNDLFALLYADEVKFSLLYEVLEFLEEETHYAVWIAATRGLSRLRNTYLGTSTYDDVNTYTLKLIEKILATLTYEPNANESYGTTRNRMQILDLACKIGHQGCNDHANSLFRALIDQGTEIIPSLRPVAYCHGLRHGSSEDYDKMWQRMATTNVANEASVIASALGCTSIEEKLRSYLVSPLVEDSPIMTQDLTVPLNSVLLEYSHVQLVLDELKQNFTVWSKMYTTMDTVLSTIAESLHTEADFTEFETWLSGCTECTEAAKTSAEKALTKARQNTQWGSSHSTDIVSILKNYAPIILPSTVLLGLGLIIAARVRVQF